MMELYLKVGSTIQDKFCRVTQFGDFIPFRIKSTIDESLLPAVFFFNGTPDSGFLECINGLLAGQGRGYNDTLCMFKTNDPDEEPFDGVKFYEGVEGKEVVVTHADFTNLLREACRSYIEGFPEQKNNIEEILSRHGCSWE